MRVHRHTRVHQSPPGSHVLAPTNHTPQSVIPFPSKIHAVAFRHQDRVCRASYSSNSWTTLLDYLLDRHTYAVDRLEPRHIVPCAGHADESASALH